MSDRYGRIRLLLVQGRHEMAERDLRMLLADDPNDALSHALLAISMLHDSKRWEQATESAQRAVGMAPDEPLCHYSLAVCYLKRNHAAEAEAAIGESLRLDPYDADAFAVLSQSFLSREKYGEALDAAEQGLQVDPEHLDCSNLKSISLERLGRGDEAIVAATDTLRRDPDDPTSHAAHGFALLNSGNHLQSQIAFREALRLDPDNEMARVGMIHALNNRSFIFRSIHKFYVLLSRLGSRSAFALIFGAWILIQVLSRVVGPAFPFLQPLIIPIVFLYVAFVVLTWIANPLFNTFLRFHPFGQHLLDRSQRWASNLIAPALALSVFAFAVALWHGNVMLALLATGYWLGLAIPISASFQMRTAERKWLLGGVSTVIALLPIIGVVRSLIAQNPTPLYDSMQIFAYGLLVIQIGGNVFAMKPVRH